MNSAGLAYFQRDMAGIYAASLGVRKRGDSGAVGG